MSGEDDEQKPLSKLFYEALKIHNYVEKADEPTNSENAQKSIKQGLKLLEIIMHRSDELRLFSSNERVDEISSANLKYLLSPAICGVLTSLVQTPRDERKELLISAEKLLFQFLERCKDYDIGQPKEIQTALKLEESKSSKSNVRDLAGMNAQREAKIAKFKRNKELEERLKHLKSIIGETDEDVENADDEVVRKYWYSVLEKWTDTVIENCENIAQEKEILLFWEKMPDKNNPPCPQASSTSQNTNGQPKNFILTRDKVQATVFGAGYPSLPSMTVEEFYESHAAAGTLPDQGVGPSTTNRGDPDEHSDSDNDEKVMKDRAFDDWKDTHRRGDGNRKNMG